MSKSESTSKPMDPTTRERAVGIPSTNGKRVCGAVKQLVVEVLELFPETPVRYGAHDGRNCALAVVFDLSEMDNDDAIDLYNLFTILDTEARVESVSRDDSSAGDVTVTFKSSARTQDNRDSFGLADAWSILSADFDGDDPDPMFMDIPLDFEEVDSL